MKPQNRVTAEYLFFLKEWTNFFYFWHLQEHAYTQKFKKEGCLLFYTKYYSRGKQCAANSNFSVIFHLQSVNRRRGPSGPGVCQQSPGRAAGQSGGPVWLRGRWCLHHQWLQLHQWTGSTHLFYTTPLNMVVSALRTGSQCPIIWR